MAREVKITPTPFLTQGEVYLLATAELVKVHPSVRMEAWPTWNQMTGGFRAREFSILCGSTGSGKTTFLANMSAQLLKQGVKHFVMSVETGHADFMKRVMSVLAGRDLNTGESINPDHLARLHTEHIDALESECIQFSIYENRVSVEQLMADLRYMVEIRGCKIAFIDNLNFFMEVTSAANQIIEMDRVIHELIIFCKQVDVHLVMVMHPKKTEYTRVESEFDVKGSSTAVQEAHNVFLFNRPKPDTDGPLSNRELKVAKMRRRGAFVGRTIKFECRGVTYSDKGAM